MPQTADRWTAEMVRALPGDGNRYEVIDGELLVTPAPRTIHQRAAFRLARLLHEYIERAGAGEALLSPADIELDPATLVQPDVFIYGLINGRLPKTWNEGAPLLLAAEVLSPGTARADRTTKRRKFQHAGVPEYWIVDLDSRTVERWRPGDEHPEVLSGLIDWWPPGAVSPLSIDLPSFFRAVLGGD